MPIGSGIVYNTGDLILSQVSSSGTAFLETKIASATSSLIYFDSTARINSASLNSITVGTASYVSGSTSIITNLTASNISASGTGSFGIVGIGTVNPAYKLDVNGNANFTNGFYTNTDASSTSYFVGANGTRPIIFQNNTGASYDFGFKFSDSNTFTIVGGNTLANPTTDLVSFTYDGKVGIGTSSPTGSLHVNNSVANIPILNLGGGVSFNNVSDLYVLNSYNTASGVGFAAKVIGVNISGSLTSGNIPVQRTVWSGVNSATAIVLSADDPGSGTDDNAFQIWTSNQGTSGSALTQKFTLTADGNVGIGTTSPVTQLHVSGSLQIGNGTNFGNKFTLYDDFSSGKLSYVMRDLNGDDIFGLYCNSTTGEARLLADDDNGTAFMTFQMNANERMRITNGGNVGIGTTNPLDKLSVSGSIGLYAAGTTRIYNAINATDSISIEGGSGITFKTYSGGFNTVMFINTAGNVGIGTTSPTARLHVSGSTGGVFEVDTVGGATTLYVTASGNVGIGTIIPIAKLQVAGAGIFASELLHSSSDQIGWVNAKFTDYNDGHGIYISSLQAGGGKWLSGEGRYWNSGFWRSTSTTSTAISLDSGALKFYTNTGLTANSDFQPSERMRINSAGNVGIGTTNPAYLLDVSGSSRHGYRTSDAHYFTGSVSISGSLNATASWATNALTASFLPVGTYNITSSWANNVVTASYLVPTNSYTITNLTASNISASGTSSFGYVGIGTTGPAQKLDVRGYVVSDVGSNAVEGGFYLGNGNHGLRRPGGSSNDVYLYTTSGTLYMGASGNSSQHLTILTGGNVGIGTTSPSNKTTIDADATGVSFADNGVAQLVIRGTTDTTKRLGLGVDTTNNIGVIQAQKYGTAAYPLALNPVGGNVGIGTTSPAYLLDVSGSSRHGYRTSDAHYFTGSVNISGSLNATASWANNVVSASYATTAQTANALNTGNSYTIAGLTNNGTLSQQNTLSMGSGYQILATTGTAPIPGIAFVGDTNTGIYSPSADTIGFSISGSEKMRIASDGSVGIGTTAFVYTSAGRGLTEIYGSTDALIALRNATANFYIQKAGNNLAIVNGGAGYMSFNNNGADRLFIDSSGNVGIGTNSPTARLHVSGSTGGVFEVDTAGGATTLYVSASGNVGIGTSSPGTTLSVIGEIYASSRVISDRYASVINGNNNSILFNSNTTSFINNGSTSIYIKSDGNVGIGTTNPGAKLEISGSSNSALLNIKSPISGAILYVSGSGAVGIGTSNVGAFTLQVSGSFGATTKSFIIDHPTKAGKKLMYGSLESPYHGIRLTGRDTLVNGKCKIQLPDYMYKLILHDSVNIQLTGIKCNKTLYIDDINIPENYFTIAYDKAIFESYKDYDFFWDFTAIRADVPELQTEM